MGRQIILGLGIAIAIGNDFFAAVPEGIQRLSKAVEGRRASPVKAFEIHDHQADSIIFRRTIKPCKHGAQSDFFGLFTAQHVLKGGHSLFFNDPAFRIEQKRAAIGDFG
ncbi:hypothetical protein JCM17846_16320 [Iodidimonas nitroreducens]|uniref:Uncharacterized protein n=1 Tax=Iodidimonas nitroreducens TaxID=1236968 RepID=A0A5A7N957_9PROT|nr:hypothetical protein [Iodidimonas nitroreducens]GER03950.1 hypothetical protein JCM17846_16320 [Iodidimonas nitroreducens]